MRHLGLIVQEQHVSEHSAVAGVSAQWPARLWVVRHGQSAGNVARDAAESAGDTLIALEHRDADVPLSALGERQARGLGEWIASLPEPERPDLILSSPYVRARQTAAAVAQALGQPADAVSVDERLREKEFGVLDRYTTAGILATFPELAEQRKLVGKFYFRPPGGESWCDVIFRLRSVVGDLQRNHVGARVLVVGHQVIVNCFRYLIERMDEATILAIDREGDVPNCGVTEYAAAPDGQTLQLVRTKFLPPALAQAPVTSASDRPAGAR
ncbi:histidine phosphatase family protein [Xanthomonas maliensis]|uniref:histidine phosphatase family protein n=1 Tax=Xanthomonas maliensis TaxID=1321368 RepID=UPI0006906AE5|nr:histidine phosphatase family protein [Xanthomonas maliensis]KAB7765659.1 histidine phosphatase family protein [Xanthomonas maliensis]